MLFSEETGRWKLANGQMYFFRKGSGGFLIGMVFEQRFEESEGRSKENSCVCMGGGGGGGGEGWGWHFRQRKQKMQCPE